MTGGRGRRLAARRGAALALIGAAALAAAGLRVGVAGAVKARARKMSDADGPAVETKINTAGWADSPFVSGDGQRLYFMYSRWNFFPFFLGGAPELRGPDRPGLHKDTLNPFDESDIYVTTRRSDGRWGTPVNMTLNGPGGDASGMEYLNGQGFVWIKPSAPSGMPDIYVSTRDAQGRWGTPVSLGPAINTTAVEDNPHLSPDGAGLWFTSDRGGGAGGKDLWFSSRTTGIWSAPVNLGPPINTAADEDQIWISPVTSDIYFTRNNQIYVSTFTGTGHAPPTWVDVGLPIAAEPSVTDDGQELYFASADTTTQRIRIMRSVAAGGGGWGPAGPVD